MYKGITLFITICACTALYSGHAADLAASIDRNNNVTITIGISKGKAADSLYLYRSYLDLAPMKTLDINAIPISGFRFQWSGNPFRFNDTSLADDCDYYYYASIRLRDGSILPSNVAHIRTLPVLLPEATDAGISLFIDKTAYFLEVRHNGTGVKRYPVSLGRNPQNRKLHQDNMSTPEGIYRVSYFKPNSAYYKAIGVSYPNAQDQRRYAQARAEEKLPMIDGKEPLIGGSIQIHGGGIGNNWTFGCIAMRNADIDELFEISGMKVGSPISIIGSEFTRDSLARPNRNQDIPNTRIAGLQADCR
jgi:lipoprotein-anchoring transpeptidase ErfK/SrfK